MKESITEKDFDELYDIMYAEVDKKFPHRTDSLINFVVRIISSVAIPICIGSLKWYDAKKQ